MQILTSPQSAHELCCQWRQEEKTIALVPTMGFFHEGHQSLMRLARKLAQKVVVSLFVNPTQFGPGEDLEAYPRDAKRDEAIAEAEGCDLLFMPSATEMYGDEHQTWVEVPGLAQGLCGRTRPLHFRGVCTVVLKLFMIISPDMAIFGEKDWQQLAIIRRMAADLNLPVKIVGSPIVRERDGLALSSRNVYLSPAQRREAPFIYRGLRMAADLAGSESDAKMLIAQTLAYWQKNIPDAEIEYLHIVDPDGLGEVGLVGRGALMVCAVRLGKTRLIDNIMLRAE